jgi:hypothetical protein
MTAIRVEYLLAQIRTNPAVVTELYPLLTKIDYQVLIAPGSGSTLQTALFLTYPTPTETRELPAFISDKYPLFNQLKREAKAEIMVVPGLALFRHLKNENLVAEGGNTELAINPGWEHGIRVSRTILLTALAAAN